MRTLVDAMGGKPAATFGWYAQTHPGVLFDGSQLLQQIEQVVASGAVYQPAGAAFFYTYVILPY